MAQCMVLEGIYTPLITPFDRDGAINYDVLAQLIEQLIDAGVHGLISGGSTGENYAETVEERLALGSFITERTAGRLPVIVGTGAMRTPDSIALAEGARNMGADAILLGTPPYSVPTEAENAANALAIDRAAGLPVILYNYPGRMSVSMGRDFLNIVSQSENVIGIKESSGDVNRIHLLACDYPKIQMSCGMDDQALEFFAWGARSWICAGSNFLPREHVALYEACAVRGDFTTGRRIMTAMMPLMAVLEQGGKFIQCVKHGVETTGLAAGPMRPPLQGLDAAEQAELEAVIAGVRATVAAILEGK